MEAGQHFVGLVLIGCVIGGDVSRVPTLDAVHERRKTGEGGKKVCGGELLGKVGVHNQLPLCFFLSSCQAFLCVC